MTLTILLIFFIKMHWCFIHCSKIATLFWVFYCGGVYFILGGGRYNVWDEAVYCRGMNRIFIQSKDCSIIEFLRAQEMCFGG